MSPHPQRGPAGPPPHAGGAGTGLKVLKVLKVLNFPSMRWGGKFTSGAGHRWGRGGDAAAGAGPTQGAGVGVRVVRA